MVTLLFKTIWYLSDLKIPLVKMLLFPSVENSNLNFIYPLIEISKQYFEIEVLIFVSQYETLPFTNRTKRVTRICNRLHFNYGIVSNSLMSALVSLHIGQAGVQVGKKVWTQLSAEHGINEVGQIDPENERMKHDYCFHESSTGTWGARGLFIDGDPSTIDESVTINISSMNFHTTRSKFFLATAIKIY